jgi:hypothetical protein
MVQDAEPIFLQNLQVLAHPFTPPLAWIILSTGRSLRVRTVESAVEPYRYPS